MGIDLTGDLALISRATSSGLAGISGSAFAQQGVTRFENFATVASMFLNCYEKFKVKPSRRQNFFCGKPVSIVWSNRFQFAQFSLAVFLAFRQNPVSRFYSCKRHMHSSNVANAGAGCDSTLKGQTKSLNQS
jgi:hypothetical protein